MPRSDTGYRRKLAPRDPALTGDGQGGSVRELRHAPERNGCRHGGVEGLKLVHMKGALQRSAALAAMVALVPCGASSADDSPAFARLVQSKLVHCAFYRQYEVDRLTGDLVLTEGHSDSLTHFQQIHGDHARQISTRMAGAHEVRVIQTDKYLHFIDQVAGMFLLTTIYGCIDQDRHGVCLTYGAMQSRHFDARVLYDPDAVYEALKDRSDPGFCDHSFIEIREASHK